MYGKHFESMYEGSMYGAGVAVFAVWGYVIANTKGSRVELNPKKLADTLGGTVEEVNSALHYLKSPDPNSRHKEFKGCRLVEEDQYQYFVPSWAHYRAIRNEEERREYNRVKQAEYRAKMAEKEAKKQAKGKTPAQVRAENEGREKRYQEALARGDPSGAEAIAAEGTPEANGQ